MAIQQIAPTSPLALSVNANANNGATPALSSGPEVQTSLKKFTKDVSSRGAKSELQKEIRVLTGQAAEMDRLFRVIETVLNKIATSGTGTSSFRSAITNLANDWSSLRQVYTDLMWDSRRQAGSAKAAVDDFVKNFSEVLVNNKYTIEVRKEEIADYIDQLAKEEDKAQSTAQGFIDLLEKIQDFRSRWESLVSENDSPIRRRFQDIQERLMELESKLAGYRSQIEQAGTSLGLFEGEEGVANFLKQVCPEYWSHRMAKISKVSGRQRELNVAARSYQETTSTIGTVRGELSSLRPDSDLFGQLEHGLVLTKTDFYEVCEKLAAFGKVWAMIRTDVQALREQLEWTKKGKVTALFKARVNSARELYKALSEALNQYQITLQPEPSFEDESDPTQGSHEKYTKSWVASKLRTIIPSSLTPHGVAL